MKNETVVKRASLGVATLLLPLLLATGPAAAQAGAGSWRAWTGCWATAGAMNSPTLCVIPTAEPAVAEIVTVVEGAVVERERIEATGQRIARVREGCTGWESAEWSADGRRLYSHSAHQCEGGLERTTSGIMSILPTGEWLNVQAVEVAGNTRVGVVRHRATEAPTVVRESVDNARVESGLALESARVAASSPITIAEAVDASRRVDAEVVEAWLIEAGPELQINRARLIELANAGVPESVIDMMVALSYPRVFAIDRDARSAELVETDRNQLMRPGIGLYGPLYGYGRYSGFGFSPYGFGYGGYPGYGYGGWYSTRPTVIVIREQDGEDRARKGRLVNNQGYEDGSRPATTRRATESATSRGSSSSATSSSGTSTSGSNSGSSTSSSGSSGRTAQPRQ